MRHVIAVLVALLALNQLGLGHGGTYIPPGDHPTPPLPDPPPFTPPETPPTRPPTDVPGRPTPNRLDVRPPGTRTRPRTAGDATWRVWWELNREHLIGLRSLLRRRGAVTGKAPEDRIDPLAESRSVVLLALRRTARRESDRTLRAAAIIALGRMGSDTDTELLLGLLRDKKSPKDVQEAAAVAIGILQIKTPQARNLAREALQGYARTPDLLETRARGLVLLSTGLRAQQDRSLVMTLVGLAASGKKMKTERATDLVYACGLARDPMVVPELLPAVRKKTLGGRRIHDMTRSHAALALGMSGDRNASRLLSAVLGGRSTGLQTRRSCALALGRLLRETALEKADVARAEKALTQAFQGARDPVLRGFAAVALGGARQPAARRELMEAIDHGGNAEVKPYCALALGLAARTLGDDGRKIRSFLAEELRKTKQVDLAASLAIALGIARAENAAEDLMMLLTKSAKNVRLRGAAAQGLGLLGSRDPDVHKTLEDLALKEKNPDLLEDVVLALGLMGRRGITTKLVELMARTKSTRVQGRIILALAHLDSSTAVDPLLDVLEDKLARPLVREFAAVALGIMGDRRDEDPLFALDAYFNFYSTTLASNELMRLY